MKEVSVSGLINVVLALAVIGVILYLIEKLPMDDTIRVVVRVFIVIAAVLFLVRSFLPGLAL